MDPHRATYCGRIKCPEVAEFRLVRPPCLNGESRKVTRVQVRKRVKGLEDEARTWREKKKRSVMGMTRVRAVGFMDAPSTTESFFGTEPTVSGEGPKSAGRSGASLRTLLSVTS